MDALELIKNNLTPERVETLLVSLGFTPHGDTMQFRSKCVIHGGNNPSAFSYTLSNHMWYCHNCGAGGDVVQLIQDCHKLSFEEATKFMLGYVGIANIEGLEFKSRPNRYYKELEQFKAYAQRKKKVNKLYTLPEGIVPKKLSKFRHFTEETMNYFEFGFIEEMPFEKLDGSMGSIKNRLAMPILYNHQTLGYAFRRTNEAENPKWLFQPKGLDKKNLIYNLEEKWYDAIILCEGQFDVWAWYQAGFSNVGCVLGASITKEQENILMRCTDTLILGFDNDDAGRTATFKSIEQLKKKFNIYVVLYPSPAKDPCDLSEEALKKCHEEKIHHTKYIQSKFYGDKHV